MKTSNPMVFIPTVDRTNVMIGDNESEEAMWKGVSENDSELSLMARELTQNSIDANRKTSSSITKVRFSLKSVDLSFVNEKSLVSEIDHCIASSTKENSSARFKRYKTIVQKGFKNLFCLVVEDTSGGLEGDSRFEGETLDIVSENSSRKSSGDLGSYGVGKSTAFYISNFGTVFYVNQKNGKSMFLGKTKLSGYTKKTQKRAFFGPNIFCGNEVTNGSDSVADWSVLDESHGLRSFPEDGLTTIIPINIDELEYHGLNWKEVCAISCIKSYFKNFENSSLELEFIDENENYVINNENYKAEFERLLQIIMSSDTDNFFKHRILICKPYVLEENPVETKEIDVSLSIKRLTSGKTENYSSKIEVTFFENEELEEFLENTPGLGKNENYNFRILRGEILVRNFNLPHYQRAQRLDSKLYCGLVQFIKSSEEASCVSELIRTMETQSHDSLDFRKLKKTFDKDAENQFLSKVINQLNKTIRDTISSLHDKEKKELEKIDIELNLGGQLEGTESGDGYYREIKQIDSQSPSLPEGKGADRGAGSGNEDVIVAGEAGDGDSQTELPDTNGDNDGEGGKSSGLKGGKGTQKDDGDSVVVNKKAVNNIAVKTKRVQKKGTKASYVILCSNLKEPNEILLYQDSIEGHKKSIRMFEVNSLIINKSKISLKDLDITDKYIGIPIKNKSSKDYLLELQVSEPEHSITEFFIKIV